MKINRKKQKQRVILESAGHIYKHSGTKTQITDRESFKSNAGIRNRLNNCI